jgi:hypothetical protein
MLILLTDTRKKLLGLWMTGTGVVILFVLLQTLTGKLEEIEGTAWTWVFVNLLPTLLLLFVAAIRNKNPSKVLYLATFRALVGCLAGYLLLMLVTLLVIPVAVRQWSIEQYFQYSWYWLLPLQIVLLVVLGMLYFRRENQVRPNGTMMVEYLSKKLEFATRTGNLLQAKALKMLTEDNGLEKTLVFLQESVKLISNDLLLLSARFFQWKEGRDLNTVDQETLQREFNRMTLALIDLIETNA